MTPDDIRSGLLREFCSRLRVSELRDGAFSIATPFAFPDGDGFPIVLEHTDDGWRFTDRGSACGHLFFESLEVTDHRIAFIRRAAEGDGVSVTEKYELVSEPYDDLPDPGDLADFIQAISRIGGVVALERSVREGYVTEFKSTISGWFKGRSESNWYPPQDQGRLYPADLRVEPETVDAANPVVFFFVGSAGKASSSALNLKAYSEWQLPISPVVTYRQGSVASKQVLRLQDAHDNVVVERLSPNAHGERVLRRLLSERGVPIPA